jgi:hypothetical protein
MLAPPWATHPAADPVTGADDRGRAREALAAGSGRACDVTGPGGGSVCLVTPEIGAAPMEPVVSGEPLLGAKGFVENGLLKALSEKRIVSELQAAARLPTTQTMTTRDARTNPEYSTRYIAETHTQHNFDGTI